MMTWHDDVAGHTHAAKGILDAYAEATAEEEEGVTVTDSPLWHERLREYRQV